MKTPRTNAQIILLTDAESEMLHLLSGERRLVPAALAESLETQLTQWVEAADASQQSQAFYDGYGEAQMRAMQAMMTNAKTDADDQAKWAKHYSDRCDKLVEQLAECAGVLASVDTERRFRDMHGNIWISQTLDWCKGAKAIGEKANALLEEHDDLSAQNAVHEPTAQPGPSKPLAS